MRVTPSGMEMDVSPVQLSKALSPMLVTLSGISKDVSPVQLAYLQMFLYQLLTS